MTKSEILICFCLSFVGGLLIASFFVPSLFWEIPCLIVGLILIGAFWETKEIVAIGFCFFFISFGILFF